MTTLGTAAPSATEAPVVMVAACSAGALVAQSFAARSPCIHVFNGRSLSPALFASVPHDVFLAEFDIGAGGFEETVELLRALAPRAVVAASELGVELADGLARIARK